MIVEGVVNSVLLEYDNLPKDKQNEIIRRRVICSTCPFMSDNAISSPEYFELFKKHYQTDRNDAHCSLCFCPIKTKTACLDCSCGAEVFNKDNKTNIEVKFTKYA